MQRILKFEVDLRMEPMSIGARKPHICNASPTYRFCEKSLSVSGIKRQKGCIYPLQSEIKLELASTWAVPKNPHAS
jgi:hypothetical protein